MRLSIIKVVLDCLLEATDLSLSLSSELPSRIFFQFFVDSTRVAQWNFPPNVEEISALWIITWQGTSHGS